MPDAPCTLIAVKALSNSVLVPLVKDASLKCTMDEPGNCRQVTLTKFITARTIVTSLVVNAAWAWRTRNRADAFHALWFYQFSVIMPTLFTAAVVSYTLRATGADQWLIRLAMNQGPRWCSWLVNVAISGAIGNIAYALLFKRIVERRS